MEYRYEPKGVCSYEMIIDIDGDTIKKGNNTRWMCRKHSWSFKISRRNEN